MKKDHPGKKSMESFPWLDIAKRLEAIAQTGLTFSVNPYDIERFEEIRKISQEMMSYYTGMPFEKLPGLFSNETGYPTPKVDIRGVVFRGESILLVKEKLDGCWALPGGWADIGLSPTEVVIKEVREEAGLEVEPVKLLGVLDKKFHEHPPSPYHVYKMFILCSEKGGEIQGGLETIEAGFFILDQLPPLSVERNTEKQIRMIYETAKNGNSVILLD